jgi:hypothetical protein
LNGRRGRWNGNKLYLVKRKNTDLFKKEACMAIEGLMKEGFVTASLDSIINWA